MYMGAKRRFAILLGIMGVMTAADSVCLAQGNVLPTAPPPKNKPCDVLTKAEAEAIMGQPAEGRSSSPFDCWYVETGWTNRPPKNKQVRLTVHTNAAPQPNELADTWKNMADHPMPTRVAKNLPNFGDAAIWNWYQGHGGELFAYRAGLVSVSVIVSGLAEDAALDHAKKLAAKMLGGSEGTGYVYNTPKIMPRMDKPAVANADALPPEKAAAVAALQGGKTFAEAVPITASQFLQEVKEVSLTVTSSPTLVKNIPEAELKAHVVDLLNFYRIAVKPNAPVALQVTVDELLSDFRTTTYWRDEFGKLPSTYEDTHIHTFEVTVEFFVRTAVWRNGVFHPVVVSPSSTFYYNYTNDANDIRKLFIGDEMPRHIRKLITEMLTLSFKEIATNNTVDNTPWPVSGWSDKEKATASAAFAKIMASAGFEERPTEGLDSMPELALAPKISDDCKHDPSWKDLWNAEFLRMGWSKPKLGLTLYHFYVCEWAPIMGFGDLYLLLDTIRLYESNVVFELNGKFFRKAAILFSTRRMMTALGDQVAGLQQSFIPRSITQFSTDLALGKRKVPPVRATSTAPVAN
jgi:hypothetical protein